MAFSLGDVIAAARNWNPRFERRFIPNKAAADYLTGRQRELVALAVARTPEFLTQVATLAFDVADANAPGTAGVGTAGGFPATAVNESVDLVPAPVGNAVALDFDGPAVVILVAERPVSAATATTLTTVGTTWTVNAWANKHVRIVAGRGQGQERDITSNTAAQVTVGSPWDVGATPDETSLFEIVDPVIQVDRTQSAVVALPATAERRSYLVRLDAGGVPYLDFARPLVARYDVGIDLPPHHFVLGGTVRGADGMPVGELHLQSYAHRLAPLGWPAAWLEAGQLFLCGRAEDWAGVRSVDVRYTPITPPFAALTEFFLLPDSAYQALVTGTAVFFAHHVNALPDVAQDGGVDVRPLLAEASAAEDRWLSQVGLQRRATVSAVKDVW